MLVEQGRSRFRAMLRHNPQWALEIDGGMIKAQLIPEDICELEEVQF